MSQQKVAAITEFEKECVLLKDEDTDKLSYQFSLSNRDKGRMPLDSVSDWYQFKESLYELYGRPMPEEVIDFLDKARREIFRAFR